MVASMDVLMVELMDSLMAELSENHLVARMDQQKAV